MKDEDVQDVLALWKTRRRVLKELPMDTRAIVYQLNKCIETLENELKYEAESELHQRG